MDHSAIVDALANFFEEEELIEDLDMLSNGTDLIEAGVIDSLILVMLVGFCEDEFDCVLEPDELVEDNFRSLDTIANFVATKLIES